MLIRRLQPEDAPAYGALRLRALREHPEAFTSSFEEESAKGPELAERRLRGHGLFWGAFAQDRQLAGMVGLDRERRVVLLGPTRDEEGREITPASAVPYDTLVIAIGSVTNDFGTPGVARHAIPLETPDQASRFHRRLVNACLRANSQAEPVRPGQLHVAIIGAGATGTSWAGATGRAAAPDPFLDAAGDAGDADGAGGAGSAVAVDSSSASTGAGSSEGREGLGRFGSYAVITDLQFRRHVWTVPGRS